MRDWEKIKSDRSEEETKFVERPFCILLHEILQLRHAGTWNCVSISLKPIARPIFISKPFLSHESTVNIGHYRKICQLCSRPIVRKWCKKFGCSGCRRRCMFPNFVHYRPIPRHKGQKSSKIYKTECRYIGCSCKYMRSNYKYTGFSCKYIRSNCKFIKCISKYVRSGSNYKYIRCSRTHTSI